MADNRTDLETRVAALRESARGFDAQAADAAQLNRPQRSETDRTGELAAAIYYLGAAVSEAAAAICETIAQADEPQVITGGDLELERLQRADPAS